MRILALLAALLPLPAIAGQADVIDAKAVKVGAEWQVEATVSHADTGWDHYADGFEIVGPDGTVLGTRVLHHPHVDEQPFTRYHTLAIPEGIGEITVRALDSVHGGGGASVVVTLPQ